MPSRGLQRAYDASYSGSMPRRKIRSSIVLEPELAARLRSLAQELPGATQSGILETALELHLPQLEAAAAAYQAAPEDKETAALDAMIRALVRTLGKEEDDG